MLCNELSQMKHIGYLIFQCVIDGNTFQTKEKAKALRCGKFFGNFYVMYQN